MISYNSNIGDNEGAITIDYNIGCWYSYNTKGTNSNPVVVVVLVIALVIVVTNTTGL